MDDSDEDIFETYAQKTPEKSYTEKSSKYSSSPNKYSSEKKETPTKSPKSNSSKDKPLCKYGASCFRYFLWLCTSIHSIKNQSGAFSQILSS
jgi:hypothetical protein